MKTIIIIADFGFVEGGAAKVAIDTIRLLHAVGFNVIFFCGSEKVNNAIIDLGIRVIRLGMCELKSNPSRLRAMLDGLWNRKAARSLRTLLSEVDIEDVIVHVHSWTKILSPSIFYELRKSGVRTIITAHDYFLTCPNGAYYDYVHSHICRLCGGSVSCLLCNCDARNYTHKIWRWLRQHIITYQVQRFSRLEILTLSDLSNRILESEFKRKGGCEFVRVNNPVSLGVPTGLPAHEECFGFVGRVATEKGFWLFIEAVQAIGVKSFVVGDGPLLNTAKKLFPSVEYAGWVKAEAVKRVMHEKITILVFPSVLYETAGLTPLEAMSMGIPCIVSDSSAAAEYIIDGKTGLLFKSGSVEDLVCKMKRVRDKTYFQYLKRNVLNDFDISSWSECNYVKTLSFIYEKGTR